MGLQCLPGQRRQGADLQRPGEVRKEWSRQSEQRTERGIENGRRGHHPPGVPVGKRSPDAGLAVVGLVRGQALRQGEAETTESETGAEAGARSPAAQNRQPAPGEFRKRHERSGRSAPARGIESPGRAQAQTGEWTRVHSPAAEGRQAKPGDSEKRRSQRGAISASRASSATGAIAPACRIQAPERARTRTDGRARTCSPTTELRRARFGGIQKRRGRRCGNCGA